MVISTDWADNLHILYKTRSEERNYSEGLTILFYNRTIQIEIFSPVYVHLHKVADTGIVCFRIQHDLVIDFGRIVFRTANKIITVYTVYHHPECFPHFALINFVGYTLLYFHNLLYTGFFHLLRNIVH